jgi:hypothetical protein
MKNSVNDPFHPFESDLLGELLTAQRRLAFDTASARPARTARKRVALAGGCAAVAAGALVAGLAAQGSDGPAAAPAALPSAAHVTAQLTDALQLSKTDVLYDQETQSSPGLTLTLREWLSPWDPAPGQAVTQRTEYLQNCTGAAGCTDSGLVQDTLQTAAMPAGAAVSGQFPWGTSATTEGTLTDVRYLNREFTRLASAQVSFNLPLTAAELQHEITAGHARVTGTAVIDGIQATELAVSGFNGPGTAGDIYVSTATHLPVRTVVTAPGGQTVTDNYQFLPDTPATQANLKVTIPSGFTNDPTLDTGSSNGS